MPACCMASTYCRKYQIPDRVHVDSMFVGSPKQDHGPISDVVGVRRILLQRRKARSDGTSYHENITSSHTPNCSTQTEFLVVAGTHKNDNSAIPRVSINVPRRPKPGGRISTLSDLVGSNVTGSGSSWLFALFLAKTPFVGPA